MRPTPRGRLGGALLALLVLAAVAGRASPGFPLTEVPKAIGRGLARAFDTATSPAGGLTARDVMLLDDASGLALEDVPAGYLALYVKAADTCPRLSWQLLAAIGKVESDHGRANLPGVRSGVNTAGCCAGPMQFNVTNGRGELPSTWDSYGDGTRGGVYDPAVAIPAAARKLCHDGLGAKQAPPDPCPTVRGDARTHRAVKRYNNACWYVHEVVELAARYTGAAPEPSEDPFVQALASHPNLSTTISRGCDPAPDVASGRLDLRVQSLLAVLVEEFQVRLSCARTGHSRLVAGTDRVSNHWVWRAVDIDRVDGEQVNRQSAKARALVEWLDRLQGPLRPKEVASPFALGHRPFFTNAAHDEHVHIGYGAMP